jgi:O-antigen chain-terminating methyltransferase
MFPSDVEPENGFDYFLFEEQFRGSEQLIKQRQLSYLAYFRNCRNVLDLGCGRGEFLDLLRENGIPARGVEISTDAFLLCREKGLDVIQQDLFAYLDSIPDGSVGGVFCSQVIEHLPSGLQIRLVSLVRQKLSAGAPVLIETINPECLYALSHNFFLDPTHVRPVHPEMLAFLMRSFKFENIEVKFSSPVSKGLPKLRLPQAPPELQQFNEALDHVNAALFGNQDYAVIGIR